MKFAQLISKLAILLPVVLFLQSCGEDEASSTTFEKESRIKQRTIESTTYYEEHNNFVLWLFENYSDSAVIYAEDPADFTEFVSRKNYEYEGSQGTYEDNSSIMFNEGELILEAPYYIRNEGFTIESNYLSATEYDSLYSVLDSVSIAFSNYYQEVAILDIIDRGIDRITSLSFTHEDELVNILTQASYSMSLAFDIDVEMGGGYGLYINPCLLAGAMADVLAYNYFTGTGDLDSPSMGPVAREFIRGFSAYAFAECYCSACP